MLYRTEPHSDKNAAYSLGFRAPQEAELRMLISVNVGLTTSILPAGEAAVAAAARCLAELGHPHRLQIFRLLIRAGQGGLSVGEIQSELGIPKSPIERRRK